MRILSPTDLCARTVEGLGLDPKTFELTSVEALAGALRRAAGFHCPCSPATLVRAVLAPLDGLVPDLGPLRDAVSEVLDALVAYGDLSEHPVIAEQTSKGRVLLYAAPPSFVLRKSGAALILGVTSDQASPLPSQLAGQVEPVRHARRIRAVEGEDLGAILSQLGLLSISQNAWLRGPASETAANHVSRLGALLDAAPDSVDIPGLTVINAATPVRFYRGRWSEPRNLTGGFVGRRAQAYGADLWCFVLLVQGRPRRFLDFPMPNSRARGCDEAWRLQLAIDNCRGAPQCFRVRPESDGTRVIDLFSPIPAWARRRWDALGDPAASAGCLFSYAFQEDEIEEELEFAREKLWLADLNSGGGV